MSFFIRKGAGGGSRGGVGGAGFAGKKRKMTQDTEGKKFKKGKGLNEEIDSDGDDIEGRADVGYESEEDLETAEEKKLRMAKLYLQEIEKELVERGDDGEEDRAEGEAAMKERLMEDVDGEKGKLRKEVTATLDFDKVESEYLQDKQHNQSITCSVVSSDSKYLYTGSKDKGLIKWELSSGNKLFKIKGGKKGEEEIKKGEEEKKVEGHCYSIICLAVSSDNKLLASGDSKKYIYIWDTQTMNRIHMFKGHKQDISGLVFRKGTHTLYSSSNDRSVKIWDVDQKSYVETLYGHQNCVTAIDAGSRERCISAGGKDRTVRVWKIVEESQLVFNYSGYSVDLVKLLNEEQWVTAGEDGHLAVWGVIRKKPLATVETCHGRDPVNNQPYWISSLATLYNTDMVATGSRDGEVRIWSVGEGYKSIKLVKKLEICGFVNSLSIALEGRLIVAALGQEHRLGRWWVEKKAKNRIQILKIKTLS